MLAVISWQCDCGMHVKAMYETDGVLLPIGTQNTARGAEGSGVLPVNADLMADKRANVTIRPLFQHWSVSAPVSV